MLPVVLVVLVCGTLNYSKSRMKLKPPGVTKYIFTVIIFATQHLHLILYSFFMTHVFLHKMTINHLLVLSLLPPPQY